MIVEVRPRTRKLSLQQEHNFFEHIRKFEALKRLTKHQPHDFLQPISKLLKETKQFESTDSNFKDSESDDKSKQSFDIF